MANKLCSTREILFRGKRTDNGGWAVGLPGYDNSGHITNIEVFNGYPCCYSLEVHPETICQYTGLTDKNGRKIFEWDIVKDDSVQLKGTIKFSERYLQFVVDDVCDGEQDYSEFMKRVEVIGNIFDNPELLDSGGNPE